MSAPLTDEALAAIEARDPFELAEKRYPLPKPRLGPDPENGLRNGFVIGYRERDVDVARLLAEVRRLADVAAAERALRKAEAAVIRADGGPPRPVDSPARREAWDAWLKAEAALRALGADP